MPLYDNSLGLLTKKFIYLIKHAEDWILDLNNVADTLEVQGRWKLKNRIRWKVLMVQGRGILRMMFLYYRNVDKATLSLCFFIFYSPVELPPCIAVSIALENQLLYFYYGMCLVCYADDSK
ncbi:hypothetical protein MKX01_010545 [Papaver californicum]|nr:hypothetical protein MKX01_010545 [Papaver californicum]